MQTKMPRDDEYLKENGEYLDLVINNLKDIMILEPVPAEMRDYSRMYDVELRQNCENISAVLKQVCLESENKELILDVVNTLPELKISIVYREEEKSSSKFVSLLDVDNYPALLVAGGLGNAMVDKTILRALKEEK